MARLPNVIATLFEEIRPALEARRTAKPDEVA
jgi:hypothetical protein